MLVRLLIVWWTIEVYGRTNANYTILQLTDFHLDQNYSRYGDPSKMCHKVEGREQTDKLGEFGDYKCDAPETLVQSAVRGASGKFPSPDLILWTGDSVPHVEGYNNQYVVDTLKTTTDLIAKYYPNTVVMPTYGNHDHAPADQHGENDRLYPSIFELWKKWIGEESRETFLRGGYYARTFKNARFLVLNTNLFYRVDNFTFTNPNDPAGQFTFMSDELKQAAASNTPVHIVAHISPGMYERKANWPWFRDSYNKKFLELILPHAKTIRWMIFGHHHTDTFHVVRDAAGRPVQVCYLAPAVTPWYSDLGDGSNNPSFRVYESDDKWNSVEFSTYFVNLTDLNENPNSPWKLEYRFTDAYNLSDLSAETVDSLVTRMEKDDSAFTRYLDFNTVLQELPSKFTSVDRLQQICSLRHADYDHYRECINRTSAVGHSILILISGFLLSSLLTDLLVL